MAEQLSCPICGAQPSDTAELASHLDMHGTWSMFWWLYRDDPARGRKIAAAAVIVFLLMMTAAAAAAAAGASVWKS